MENWKLEISQGNTLMGSDFKDFSALSFAR